MEKQFRERVKSKTIRLLDLEFSGTLEQFEYPYFDYVMTLFTAYDKNGLLPFPGSLAEQPAQVIDIFNVLGQIQFETHMKIQKDHQAQMNKMNNRRSGVRR